MNKSEFEKIGNKYKRDFDVNTPNGNNIKGIIITKRNRFLGSLKITEVNGEKTTQYVQGFPKIHYLDKYHEIYPNGVYGFEKLDGSCIGAYPLFNKSGELIEVVYKSRGLPVCDKNLYSMLQLCDTLKIEKFFRKLNNDKVLFFELYGIKNLHEIKYYDTYIDLALIGVYDKDRFVEGETLRNIAYLNDFDTPKLLFKIDEDALILTEDFDKYFKNYYSSGARCFNIYDIEDGINKIKVILDEVNKKHQELNNRILTEGIVLNGHNHNMEQMYLKVKPTFIEEKHKGIPKSEIKKEIYKLYDEYDVKKLYVDNPNLVYEMIINGLSEEYSIETINENLKVIEKTFLQVAKNKEVPNSINNIAHELVERYPNENITDLMRIFAREYPFYKSESSLLFGVLKVIKNE